MKRLALLLVALPMPAFAHPGEHSHSALGHFLTEPDHLAMLAGVVVALGYALFKWRAK